MYNTSSPVATDGRRLWEIRTNLHLMGAAVLVNLLSFLGVGGRKVKNRAICATSSISGVISSRLEMGRRCLHPEEGGEKRKSGSRGSLTVHQNLSLK